MRLDKFLVEVGIGSRKEVQRIIKEKRVSVNGIIVGKKDDKVNELADKIYLDGELLVYRKYIYIMLNKPQGIISATEDKKEKTVLDLLDKKYRSVFPVGRLDKNTEGLLLLTNDGQLAHQLLSPKKHVDKVYFARVKKEITDEIIEQFETGIVLDDGYQCMPAKLVRQESQAKAVYITIQEGKFHQVKRMFEAVDNKVLYLKREKMGPLELDTRLALGDYRELSASELEQLKKLFS